MEVLPWHTLSIVAQVKLLFLLDIGDVTSQDIDNCDNLHVLAPEEARDAFLSVLQDRHHRFERVAAVVQGRVKHLLEYPFISVAAGTEGADLSVRRDDEDLLTLVHACRFLHIECRHLREKTKKVQEKLDLDDEEMEGNSFIYAENLRMLRICDGLTAQQVAQLVSLTVEDKTLRECVATGLEVSAAAMEHTEGLKEVSFFYLIRSLELGNKLNRIYTNKLEVLLQQLRAQAASEAERRMLSEAITSLSDYPGGGRPAGYCMVFCVTRGRKGAQAEIDKVKHVFGKSLGYNVNIVENPDREMLQECLRNATKTQV
ncbi:hypothetical protein GWK47_036462 [Chionoecetes opilio]|uniref:Uncharacterized protein n=1 Tax=Chionoecetes opilio TaxID=41210 RepID=A0A8J4YRG1_CHIOP|nr:hypothetical protein GWK47_036462 [Chionoecetes opilio]